MYLLAVDGEAYNQEIDPEDHATLDALAPAAHGEGGKTLADLIFSKMEGGAVTQGIEEEGEPQAGMSADYRRGTTRSKKGTQPESHRGVHKVRDSLHCRSGADRSESDFCCLGTNLVLFPKHSKSYLLYPIGPNCWR